MISSIPPSTRIRRIVLVSLFAIFASVVFVTAQKSENNLPSDTVVPTPLDATAKTRIAASFGKLPLSFEFNKGQVDQPVKFLSHGAGYDLFLTATEAVLRVEKPPAAQQAKSANPEPDANVREGSVLRLKMLGANATPEVEGQDELPGKVNYFIGNDPAKWRRNIPTYRKAHFKDVYPGIDVVYYGKQRELEYDFVVEAGANPKLIRFTVEGAEKINLDKSGRLQLSLKFGEVSLNKPVIYQLDENGSRREVKGTYVINGNEVRFKLEQFDSSKSLVIDPILSYSTLLGSTGFDNSSGIAVDSQGSAYVTGTTEFSTFPTTPGAFRTTGNRGAFVSKLDQTGSTLVYSTYITGGNNGTTSGLGIAVDSSGNAHITGNTNATDFPTVNGIKTTSNFSKTTDAAANWKNQNSGVVGDVSQLAVVQSAPNSIYATTSDGFYRSIDGGATWAKSPVTGLSGPVNSLGVNPANASIVFGGNFNGLFKSTDSGNNWTQLTLPVSFPSVTSIVFDPVTPSTMYVGTGNNGVFKSTDSGSTWITQNNFNVAGTPSIRVLAIDPSAPLTIYAGTFNNGLFKSTNGGGVWTAMNTGMGGNSPTSINAIAIDPTNTATIYTGHGSSGGINKSINGAASWTPLTTGVPNAQVNAMVATSSAVYAAFDSAGVIKTTNGGTNWTSANAGLWSTNVRALVPSPADSSTLYAGTLASFLSDAFITKLNPTGSGLLFSTLLGGTGLENGNGIAVDGSGNIYVAGETSSLNFPVVNAVQPAPAATDNCHDAFVTKLNPAVPSYVFSTYLRGGACDTASGVATDGSGNVYVTGSTGSSDFLVANAFQPALAAGGFNLDAFVTKLASDGAMVYSTYLGGTSSEIGLAIAADSSGNAYVTGSTSSTNFPTMNPIQATNSGNSEDVFITKFNSQGSALLYSTYLGGSSGDQARSIAVDSANNAYITGSSSSIDFPLVVGALRTRSPIYKSIDGAANWSNDNYGFGAGLGGGASVTALALHPTDSSIVYAATGGGVFKSANNGRTWSAINNGLASRSVSSLVIDPVTPSTLYVLVSDFTNNRGVYKSTDGGGTWIRRSNGLISTELFNLIIDPVTPNTLYVGVGCCLSGSHIYKTTDGADNWAPVGNAPPQVPTALAIDPLNHSTLYASDGATPGNTFKSIDAGATWQSLGATVLFARSIAASPLTPGLVYAATDQGLFRSVDGGSTWTFKPSRTGKIVFDPVSASTIYLLTTSFSSTPEGVLRSTDDGQTWIGVNNGLKSAQVTALAIDPLKPSRMYLGSPTSGFSSSDAFVTKINPAGSVLIYSTFLSGTVADIFSSNGSSQGTGIAVDGSGNAYVSGTTSSLGFLVTANAYQPFNRGGNDLFISKLGMSFNITGQVLNNGATPLSGVEVILNDGGALTSVLTESDGTYRFTRLREGGTFAVTAAKPHFTITPAGQTFNNLNSDQVLNFNAIASDSQFFTISGQIAENGVGLAGVTVSLSGSQSGLRTTDSNGNYSFELIAGGNYTLIPTASGFTFAAASQTFNSLSANQTANFTANRQNLVVTNTNNHGSGSLRDAIINANATLGTDTITFNIPGPGVKTITLLNALPEIMERVVIDATTQPGYAGTPLVELDGVALGNASGLVIKAGGTTVRGFSIGNLRNGGAGIVLNNCDNNVIQANYLGVAADGTTVRQNSSGLVLTNSSNNLIGGTTAATRNVISGNSSFGILASNNINGSGNSNGNVIQGNFIGTNAAGTAGISILSGFPSQSVGISIGTANFIGGTAPGAGNLISGNQNAITVGGTGTTIQGNLIGTDVTGTKKAPNNSGITAFGSNILIGGLTPGARNVISGNSGEAVNIRGGAGNRVQGNFIGTDITGTLALSNIGNGVNAGDNTLIGGTEPEARNVISANGGNGNIVLGSNFSGSLAASVQGNYIGTDVSGTRAVSGTGTGISIFNSDNIIGGTVPGARNVISGNSIGIQLGLFSGNNASGNLIQGNFIGLNAAGTGPVPNTQQGITITGAANNIIGGTAGGASNKIAFNGGPGISASSGAGNAIRGNSIFSNSALGIDLAANGVTGVTPNDVNDSDSGPNNFQNFPVITTVLSSANSTTIQGSLKSIPLTTFQIDFFSNAAVDPSGNGEGAQFFNTTSVNTDANGDATINVTFPAGLPGGRVITATATDPNGNTSEFSAADSTNAIGSVQFSVSSLQAIEDVGALTVTVLRTGGGSSSLSVEYATNDLTAVAGQDYTSTSGTLNFAAGETSKTFQIPILDDSTTETDEIFTVVLRNAPTLESLGSPSLLTVTLQDRSTTPTLAIGNPSVIEGNNGSTIDALFTITLSAATGRTVSGNFATSNFNAFGGTKCNNNDGVDYITTSGNFLFQPGTTTFTIPVKVCGDNNAEAAEQFRVLLTNPVGAQFFTNLGFATIVNDDVLGMLLEESGPNPNQAAAMEAVLLTRDPFRLFMPDWYSATAVNTRVMLFAQNLQLNPGEFPSSVNVRFVSNNTVLAQVFAEDVRPLRESEFTQVVFRLPNTLPAGTYSVFIVAHGLVSNGGTIRIVP